MASQADPAIRAKAIEKLGNIGAKDPEGIDTIIAALDDSASEVRKVAIYAIVRIGAPCSDAFEKLESMSRDDADPEIRKIAGEAYGNLTK